MNGDSNHDRLGDARADALGPAPGKARNDGMPSDFAQHDLSRAPLDALAWSALVARWVEVARASRAVPAADARLRDSIAPLIAIEATTAALGELVRVPEEDRPHARALAEISIRRAAGELDRLWRGVEWPDELHAACEAAERALRLALYAGLEELVIAEAVTEVVAADEHAGGPASGSLRAKVVPDLGLAFAAADPSTHAGTLAAMPPGSLAMPGEPVAWWCGRGAPGICAALPAWLVRRRATLPRQVYRGLDDAGRFTEDLVADIESSVAPGLPMLTPLLVDGQLVGRFLREGDAWLAMQRAALGERDAIPVRHG